MKFFGSGITTSIISNEEMNHIMKIIKFLEESSLLINGVSQTIKNGARDHRDLFLCMLLSTWAASLLKYLLRGKEVIWAGEGTITAGEGAKAMSQ